MDKQFNGDTKRRQPADEGSLADLSRGYAAAVLRHAFGTAKRMGLEPSELAALEHLHDAGAMAMSKLGERLSITRGAVTAMVDRLEGKGYVRRVRNPEDRRSSLVEVTDAGLEETLGHLRPYIEEMRTVEDGFSGDERAAIARFLGSATEITHRYA